MDGATPATTTTINLGGRPFLIRKLAIRQSRVVIPAVGKLAAIAAGRTDPATSFADKVPTSQEFDLMLAVALAGIQRELPGFTMEELLDLPITYQELIAAVPVIAAAAGMAVAAGSEAAAPKDPPSASSAT